MPLFFTSANLQGLNGPSMTAFEARMGQGPRLGALGAPTNTLATTTPFSASVSTLARRMGYTGGTPMFFLIEQFATLGSIAAYLDPICAAAGIVGTCRGDAPMSPGGQVLTAIHLWGKFKTAVCASGTPGAEGASFITKFTAISGVISALAGVVASISPNLRDIAGVASEVGGNMNRLVAEVQTNLCPGNPCPAGQGWIASRSMPGGGVCMTAEQYAAFVRGTVKRLNINLFAPSSSAAAKPWSTGAKVLAVLGIAVLVGGGVALAQR